MLAMPLPSARETLSLLQLFDYEIRVFFCQAQSLNSVALLKPEDKKVDYCHKCFIFKKFFAAVEIITVMVSP